MVNQVVYAVKTDQGHVRSNNEDNFYVNGQYKHEVWQNKAVLSGTASGDFFLAAVCDGMGGEECGEQASLCAVEALRRCHFADVYSTAVESVAEANNKICDLMRQNDGKRSGSTLAAIYIDDGKAISCNLGDSRIYLFRDGVLKQISTDHNMAAKMIQEGLMTKEEAQHWSGRHQITQYLGIFEEEMVLEPDFSEEIELKSGDIFLLCSDGLTDMVWEEEITAVFANQSSVMRQTEELVQLALDSGGSDNITVIVIQIQSGRISHHLE